MQYICNRVLFSYLYGNTITLLSPNDNDSTEPVSGGRYRSPGGQYRSWRNHSSRTGTMGKSLWLILAIVEGRGFPEPRAGESHGRFEDDSGRSTD